MQAQVKKTISLEETNTLKKKHVNVRSLEEMRHEPTS